MKQYKEKLKRNGISVSQELRYKLHLDINIRKFFAKKGVVIGKFSLIFDLNSIELYMPVYFTNKAIVKFKKARILKKTSHNPFYQSYGMIKYLLKDFSSEFNTQSIVINFNNLNLLFNTNSFVSDYLKKLVFFKKILFTRRLFLFLDFIKLTWLFSINAISTDAYVYIFGEIFKRLPKIKHAQFMRFVKTSISYLFDKRTNFGERIKGVKFILSGKYKGKLRAKSVRYVAGFIPLKTIACGITESATVAYTIYGTFGIKMWIYTESSKKGKKKLENFCKRKHSLKLFIKIIRRRKYWQLRKTLLRKYALNLGYNRKNFSRASKQFSKYNKSKYLKKDSKFNNQFLKNKQISKFNYNDDKKTTQLWKNHLKKKYQPLSKKKEFFKNNLDVVSKYISDRKGFENGANSSIKMFKKIKNQFNTEKQADANILPIKKILFKTQNLKGNLKKDAEIKNEDQKSLNFKKNSKFQSSQKKSTLNSGSKDNLNTEAQSKEQKSLNFKDNLKIRNKFQKKVIETPSVDDNSKKNS